MFQRKLLLAYLIVQRLQLWSLLHMHCIWIWPIHICRERESFYIQCQRGCNQTNDFDIQNIKQKYISGSFDKNDGFLDIVHTFSYQNIVDPICRHISIYCFYINQYIYTHCRMAVAWLNIRSMQKGSYRLYEEIIHICG